MKVLLNTLTACLTICLIASCSNEEKDLESQKRKRAIQRSINESHMEFDTSRFDNSYLHSGWYYVSVYTNGLKRLTEKTSQTVFIDTPAMVSYNHFFPLEKFEDSYQGKKFSGIVARLDKEGTELFSVATGANSGWKMALIVDNKVVTTAIVEGQIKTGVTQILLNDFSDEEIQNLVKSFNEEIKAPQRIAQ